MNWKKWLEVLSNFFLIIKTRIIASGRALLLPPPAIEAAKVPVEIVGDPPWMKVAEKELGVVEFPLEADNPRILAYHLATRLKATQDSVPWCAAFVCWCLETTGMESPKSARARDFAVFGAPVPFTQVKRGDVVVLSRGGNPSQGHVGFYHSQTDLDILLVGGNQGNAVSIMNFPKSRIVAVRRPTV